MQDATGVSQDTPAAGYSLQEAATLLGIGVNTLRRRIAAGQIRAAQVERPQGYVWRVYLNGRHPPNDPTSEPPIQEATGSLPHPPTQIAPAEAMVSLIQTTIATVLGPLVAEQTALRQTVERQAEIIAELREDRGRLSERLDPLAAERDALRTELAAAKAYADALQAQQEARETPSAPNPDSEATPPWWLSYGLLAAVVVIAIVGAVVGTTMLLTVPR
jgi:hypothetical protein